MTRFRLRQHIVVLFTGLLVLTATGCRRSSGSAPPRVVSLVPSVTEVIFALNRSEVLVGNTVYCDYPEAARSITKVGDFSHPNIEKILSLKPSLVFATLPEQRATVERLQQLGMKVVISRPTTIEGLFTEILTIGRLLQAEHRGLSLVDSLRQRLAALAPRSVRRVYLELSAQPLITVGSPSFLNEVIARAGGRNVFADLSGEYPIVTQEQVIQHDPEVILILHPATRAEEFRSRLGWQEVNAVRTGRVYDDLNPDLLLRPGPRIVEGIEQLAERIGR